MRRGTQTLGSSLHPRGTAPPKSKLHLNTCEVGKPLLKHMGLVARSPRLICSLTLVVVIFVLQQRWSIAFLYPFSSFSLPSAFPFSPPDGFVQSPSPQPLFSLPKQAQLFPPHPPAAPQARMGTAAPHHLSRPCLRAQTAPGLGTGQHLLAGQGPTGTLRSVSLLSNAFCPLQPPSDPCAMLSPSPPAWPQVYPLC